MKTRSLVIFICLLVSLSLLLTACAGGSTQSSSSTSATTATTTASSSTSVTTSATTSATTSSTATVTTTTTTSTGSANSLIDILGLGKNITSIKFDLTMTITGQSPINMTVWQKQKMMREELTTEGMNVSVIFDIANSIMYTYMPDQNMAMKATLDMSMVPDSPTSDVSGIMDYSPIITGTETIDGKVCQVISFDQTGAGSVKMWLWEEKGLPLKMEMVANGTTTTIVYNNIDFSDIPDSIFELPDGVTIVG